MLIQAMREVNWDQHLASFRAMLPLIFRMQQSELREIWISILATDDCVGTNDPGMLNLYCFADREKHTCGLQ